MKSEMPARAFEFRPLYQQVKESLIRRLIDGAWQPGQLIPSEMELAREIGVSQGTIRKALDAMAAENLLVRRQGRGTYVATPEESRILFHYFRLVADTGERRFPNSRLLKRRHEKANRAEREALDLPAAAEVWRISRVRTVEEKPTVVEMITLPAVRFSGFGDIKQLPNNLYRLYSERWGVTIARASEKLKAVAAGKADAAELRCAPGTPLLEITRVAYDLENTPVELRVSRCLTQKVHYYSELR